MASTRLIRTSSSRPSSGFCTFPSNSSPSSFYPGAYPTAGRFRDLTEDNREKSLYRDHNNFNENKPVVSAKAAVATSESVTVSEPKTDSEDLVSLVRKVIDTAVLLLKMATSKRRPWKLHAQMFIERIIVDTRFFTLFAVAGSLLGSVLCFVEGCFVVIESYLYYFHALSERSSNLGHVMELLIESIDMFLVGTAMLIFGMGLHVMFVGAKHIETKGSSHLPASNFFGLFPLKRVPRWASMGSVTEAKSKMGQAVMMIMQVGMLEKFKTIPVVTGFDLACFAGAVFVSSASVFLLSQLDLPA